MLRSMTAFGRGQSLGENENFLVEIHSVNSRRLEIIINIPGELTEFDPALRKLVAEVLSRGRVVVFVSSQPAYDRGQPYRANTEMAKHLKRAYDELKTSLGYDTEVDFSLMASRHDLIVPGNPPADAAKRWEALKAAADTALARLIAMKEAEGRNLRGTFDDGLDELGKIVGSIQGLSAGGVQRHRDALEAKVREVSPGLADNEERILREIAILADRLDMSEEIARLKSHIEQFRSFMEDAQPRGRTLDFLVQEMNREINTIGAKADDLMISRLVVRGKTELEKLREQSHNIE